MKNKKPLLMIGAVVIGIGTLLLIVALVASRPKSGSADRKIASVVVQNNGNTLEVEADGRVSFMKDGKTYEDYWDSDKVATFFEYLDGRYVGEGELVTGGQNYIVISGSGGTSTYVLDDDELVDAVEEETETGGGGGGETDGGGSTEGSGGGGSTPTVGPTTSPSGGGVPNGIDPECLYWRLSYCVRKRTPTPVPSATPLTVEIREPDCGANTQTGKTVIGNDLCISTPSPTPI